MKTAINSDEMETVARIKDNKLRRAAFAEFMAHREPWEKTWPHDVNLWEAFNAGYWFRKSVDNKRKA